MENWKPCPLCGKTKRLQMTTEDQYLRVLNNSGSASIRVGCLDCDIELWEHTHKVVEYAERIKLLMDKWNRLPRRGDEVDKDELNRLALERVWAALKALEEGA